MTDGWFPGAIRKEIPKWRTPRRTGRGQCLHVAVSEADSLFGFFRSALVVSHFYVRRDGTAEQYVSIRYRSAANGQGNPTLVTYETQGGVHNANGEPWTPAQTRTLAAIVAWVAAEDGSPLALMPNSRPSSRGVGWHRQGIDGNFDARHPGRVAGGEVWSTSRGKVCPGNAKIDQVPGIVAHAAGGVVTVDRPVVGNGGGVKSWLEEGDRGDAVVELQRLLIAAGWSLAADGVFGVLTETAVKEYQGTRGLVIDGIAGEATLGALRSGAPSIIRPIAAPLLRRGSSGPEVARLQRFLAIPDDGVFGDQTHRAVVAYQRGVGLDADGVVGPLTWAKVNAGARPAGPPPSPVHVPPASSMPTLKVGSTGGWVRELQSRLNVRYPAYSRLTPDGVFGPATAAVVREFQRRSGLVADGIVGPLTRAALGF